MSSSDIHEVANYLISEAPYGISHRELQKLLYFAQGFYLSQHDEPLFDSDLDAWKFGPVNSSIWGRFREFGYHSLTLSDNDRNNLLSNEKKTFLAVILSSFFVLGEAQLIDMSHTDYTWEKNYVAGLNNVIDKELIKEYFSNFASMDEYKSIASEKVAFAKMIENRQEYLANLPAIGNDWLSGNASSPSNEVCRYSKQFLSKLQKNLFSNHARPFLPKILMGPIPTGGVGIEIFFEDKNLYLHFHNSKTVEVSIENNDLFDESDTTIELFDEEIGQFLNGVV